MSTNINEPFQASDPPCAPKLKLQIVTVAPEIRFALGLEFATKTLYARAAERTVEVGEQAKLTIQKIIHNMRAEDLTAINDITVIQAQPKEIEIDTLLLPTFYAKL